MRILYNICSPHGDNTTALAQFAFALLSALLFYARTLNSSETSFDGDELLLLLLLLLL